MQHVHNGLWQRLGDGATANYFGDVMQRNNRRKEYTIADMIPFASDYWTNGEGAAYDVGNMLGSSAVLGAETAAIAATGGAALGALGVGGAGAAAAARGAGLAGRALAGARVGAFVSNGAVGGLAIGGGNTVMRAGANRLDAREEEAEPPINNPNEQSVQRPKPVAVQAQEYLDELYDNENLTDDQRNEIGTAADSEDANAVLQTATKYGWQNPTQQQQDSQGQSAINAQSTTEEQLTAANGAVNAAVNNVANGGAVVGNMNANGEVAQVDNGAAAEQAVAADNAAVQQQENEQLQQLQGQVAVAEEIPAIKLNGKEVRPQFIEGGKRISFKAPGFGKKASATEKADYQKAGFKWDSKLQAHVADNTEEARAFLQKYNKENVGNANASSQNMEQQEDNDNASDADKIDKHGYFVQVGDFVTDESKKNTKNVHYYVLKDGVASNGVVAACVRREYQEENIADYVYTVVFFGEHKTEKTIRGLHGLGEVDKALKGYKKIKFGKANAGASEGAKNAKKFPLRNKLGGWEIDVNASTAHTLVYHPTDADSKLSRAEVLIDKDGDGFDIQFREKNGHLVEGADYWFDTVEEAEEFLKTFDERNLELEGEKNESESSTKSEQDSVQNEQSETVEQSEADDNQDKGDNGKAKEVTGKPKNDKAEEAATIDNVAEKYPEAKDSRGVLKALKGIKAEDRPAAKEYNSKLMKKIIDDILQQCDEGKITVTKALEEIQKLIGAYTDSKPFAPLAADDNHAASYGVKEYMREAKVKLKEKAEVEAANKEAKRANAIAEAQKTTQAIIDVFKVNAAKTLQEVQKEIEDVKSKLEAALKELGVKPLTANERKSVYDSKLKVANAMQTSREVAAEAAWQKEIRDKEKAEAAEVEKARKEKQKAEKADKQETQVEEDSPAKMKQEVKARVNEAVALAEEAAYGNKETGEVDQEKKNEYDEKIRELVKPNRKYPKELANIIEKLREFTKTIVPKTYYRYFRPASELEKAAFELAPEGVYNEALSAEDINLDALGLELDEQAKEDIAVNGVVEAVLDDYGNEPDEATAVKEMLEEAEGTEGFEVSKAVAKRLQEVLKKREAIYGKYYGPLDTAREALKAAMIKAGLNPPKSLDLVQLLETDNAENHEAKFSIRKNMTQKDYEQRLQVDSDKFAKIVDEWEKNPQKWFDNHKNQLLDFMSQTPLVLTLVGAEQLPVKITAGFLGHATKGAHPGMSAKVLKQIPQAMTEPLMVLKNFENVNGKRIEFPNKKILVLKLKNDYGATIIVPLKLDVEEKRGFGKINLVQTAFGVGDKKPKYQYFVDALQNNEVLYIDDKRSLEWAKTAKDARTDTLAGLIRKRASDDIILHKQALVNKRNKFLNTLYQAAWHGTPAIIEGNLTTQRIGEGEGAIVHGWGLYFAKSRETSQVRYRERLARKNKPKIEFAFRGDGINQLVVKSDGEDIQMLNEEGETIDRLDKPLERQLAGAIVRANGDLEKVPEVLKEKLDAEVDSLEMLRGMMAFEGDESDHSWWEAEREKAEKLMAVLEKALEKAKTLNIEGFKYEPPSKGELLSVELPENDVLLDEQKPFEKQPFRVRKALERIFNEVGIASKMTKAAEDSLADIQSLKENNPLVQPFVEELKEEFKKYNAGEHDTRAKRLFRMTVSRLIDHFVEDSTSGLTEADLSDATTYSFDAGFRDEWADEGLQAAKDLYAGRIAQGLIGEGHYAQGGVKIGSCFRGDGTVFDPWTRQKLQEPVAEIFRSVSGREIYKQLMITLSPTGGISWGAAKLASLKLLQHGIKGIHYMGETDGECFVIWDDNAIEIKQHYDAAIRKHKQEFERSYDEIVSKVKQMFGSEAKIKQLQNNDLEVTTGNGKKFLVKVSDKVLVSEAELKRARSEHGFKDNGEVTVEGKFLPLEDSAYDGIIEVSKESRKNTEAHEITHAVVRFALDDKESDILYKRAEQIAKEYGLTANAEEVAADAIRNFVSAREHGYVTDFTKSEIAKLNKTSWGRMMLRANRLGRKAVLFTKLNEERLSKSAWGRLVLAKAKLQRAVAKLFRKIYDSFKRWQALSKSIDSFHDLARRIELGEVWNEKNLDKTTKNSGIIKKNGVENGGMADGNDGRGQEDLRGTAGRVQGRQVGFGDNRGDNQRQRTQHETSQRDVRGILTARQTANYENIDPTIHADEWQDASSDLQGFSNALNEARAANKHGAFVDGKSPKELQSAKVAMTADGLAGCAVEDDGNITAVFKNPSKKAPAAVRSIITMARAMGGTKMDCFGKDLVKMYERLGYKVVARIPFTDKYIEKHDDGTAVNPEEQILLDERPDVYVLMTNGDDFATATQKIKNGEYKVSTQEELDALPVFEQLSEDDDNYTRALNYRDGLLKKQQKGRAQYSIRQKSTAQDPGITGINSQYKDELEKAYAEGANNNKIAAIMNAHQQALSEYMQQAGEAKRERNKIRAAQLRQDRKDFKEGKIDSYTVGGVTIIRGKDGAEVVKEVTEELPTRKYTNERHANEKPANATQKLGAVIARPEEKSTVQKAKGWITELKDNFYKHWVDKYDALSILDGAIADADGKPINPADTILGRTQMVTNAASGAARALIDGDEQMLRQLAGRYKIKNMVSLQMLMEKIGAARDAGKFADYVKSSNAAGGTSLQSYIDAVENYLVARSALESAQNHRLDYDRAVAEWEEKGGRGKKPEFKEYKFPGGMTEAEVVSVIRSAPAEFKEYAKMFKGITDNMLDVLYNSGLITGERYLAIKERYKAYCPLMRDFSDTAAVDSFIDQINGGKGIGNVSDPLKNRSSEGSERDIVPPLATIIKSINALTMKAERNRVGQYAVRQAKKHRLDNYIKEVEGSSGDSKNCIFTVVIDGKKHSYQTIPELYPAITAAVEPLMKVEMALLTKPAQLLRTGSTMSPSFIIRNFLRDTLFAAVSTKNGFVPIYDSIRGAYALLHNKQLRGEFMSSGVVSSNFYGDGESIMRNLNDMAGGRKWEELSAWEIVKAVLGKPIQGLEWTSNLIEQSTRMGEFMRAREKGKNVEQAAYDAVEITLNFNRSGATGRQINRMVPFFNACIQGGDKLYRLFKADPKTTLLRIGIYMVLPSLVLWLMNHDEDWYKELDPNIKMQNWILPGGIRIPKPQEAGVLFGSGFEAALDTANGQDPKAMKIWSKAVLENLAPGIFPTLILPLLEWQANYSFFRGKPVVSKSQERLPDELQYGPYTSEASKAVGSVTGLSPAKLDNLWRGYTGTMGMALWQAPDLLVAEKRNLPEKKLSEMAVVRDFVINDMNLNRTMNDFYALSQAATQWQAGYGKKGKPTVEVSGINTAARTIAKLQKEARDITSSPKYNSAQKRILVDKLQAKQRKIAELCIKKYGGKFNY